MDPSTTPANMEAAGKAFGTIGKFVTGQKDEMTNKPVTSDAYVGALKMGGGFSAAENLKLPATIINIGANVTKSIGGFFKDLKDKTDAGIKSIQNWTLPATGL